MALVSLASAMALLSVAGAIAVSIAFWCGRLYERVEHCRFQARRRGEEDVVWMAKHGEACHTREDCGCLRQSKAVKRVRVCAVC